METVWKCQCERKCFYPLSSNPSKLKPKYLLLTVIEARTVSYGPSFFFQINGKKRGSVPYSTDVENEVSKIFIISLRLIGRAGNEQLSLLAGRTVKYGPLN